MARSPRSPRISIRLLRNAIGAAALLFLPESLASADYEAVGYGVTDYDPCNSSDLTYCTDDAIAAINTLYNDLNYDVAYYHTNLYVDGPDFADNHAFSWGNDDVPHTGADWADVLYFSGHGGRDCSGSPKFNWLVMGDDNITPSGTEDCRPRLTKSNSGWLAGHIRLADGGTDEDTNVAIFDASHSLTWCVVSTFEFMNIDKGGSGAQFAEINGYYGSPRDTSDNDDDTHDYLYVSGADGIGDNWVDMMTDSASATIMMTALLV